MLYALTKACGDLQTRPVLVVLVRSLVITLSLFVALAALLAWASQGTDLCDWAGVGACPLDTGASSLAGILAAVLAGWFLFPAVALGILAVYADRIVNAVEARHYPNRLTRARSPGLTRTALLGLRSSARLLLVNLAALPFYLLLFVTGIGPLALFVIVNGWAAGEDLGELITAGRGDREQRRSAMRVTRGARFGIGVACALLFLVPVLNLLAPVIGAAAVAHLFNQQGASDYGR